MLKDYPEVSIIVRTKDREVFLARAIRSIIDQSFFSWEVLIINNGGDNEKVENVVLNIPPDLRKKIRIVHLEQAHKMEYATNIGIKCSIGKYIAILDDDDTWNKEFLTKTVEYMNENNIDGVITKTVIIYEEFNNGKINIKSSIVMNEKLNRINKWNLAKHNQFTTNAFIYKKSIINRVGLYNEELPVLGDWEFNLRVVLSKFKIGVINENLCNYHRRINYLEKKELNNSNKKLHLEMDWILRKRIFKMNLISRNFLWSTWLLAYGIIVKLKSTIKNLVNKYKN